MTKRMEILGIFFLGDFVWALAKVQMHPRVWHCNIFMAVSLGWVGVPAANTGERLKVYTGRD